jgi:hypothetical protein
MRISSAGNVGIGTSSPQAKLQVGAFDNANALVIAADPSSPSSLYFGDGTGASLYRGFVEYVHETDTMYIGTSATTKMTITSGGNVGIGTSSPAYKIDAFESGGSFMQLYQNDGTYNRRLIITSAATGGNAGITMNATSSAGGDNFIFQAASTERMRITSGGNVLIGSITDNGQLFQVNGTGAIGGYSLSGDFGTDYSIRAGIGISGKGINIGWNTSADNGFIGAVHNGTAWKNLVLQPIGGAVVIGTLAGSGTRAVLADSDGVLTAPVSDISVKENITSIGYGLNEILKMNPVWFDFVDEYKNFGEGRQNGNIAQEIAEIIPEAVFTTPSTGKMGINYDQLHAVYIKAIQELKAEIDILKNN